MTIALTQQEMQVLRIFFRRVDGLCRAILTSEPRQAPAPVSRPSFHLDLTDDQEVLLEDLCGHYLQTDGIVDDEVTCQGCILEDIIDKLE